MAAGDGRLTAEELDQRLEVALTARTYGELERLLVDLPAVPGDIAAGSAPAAVPTAKEFVELRARHSNVQRVGPWVVPQRMAVEARSGNVVLDFTQAVVTRPNLDIRIESRSGNITLVVPHDITVDVDDIVLRSGNLRQRHHHQPDVSARLLITLSGNVRSGNVTVRGPRRGFWAWLLRRPAR